MIAASLLLWLAPSLALGLATGCAGPPSRPPSEPPAAERSDDATAEPKRSAGSVSDLAFRDAFVDRARELGVDFRHHSGARGKLWMPETTGSGLALFDVDGDGDLDIYFVQGGWLEAGDSETDAPSDRLFRNLLAETGQLAFEDITEEAGLVYPRAAGRGYGQGVAVGDFDRDGDADLFVTALGPDRLLRNDGGRFTAIAADGAGWDDPGWSTSAVFVDLDLDREPELFVARYLDYSTGNHKDCYFTVGSADYCKPLSYSPVSDRLYRRDGGRWTNISAEAGLTRVRANGLGVLVADLDGDARPEIVVANDQMANHLWTHDESLQLREDGSLAGVSVNAAGVAEASMGVVAADFDRDGRLDLFMTHLAGESHTLYRGLGGGLFDDATDRARLSAATLAATSFGVAALDFDQDGWVDLAVASGSVHLDPNRPTATSVLPLEEPDLLLRNVEGSFLPVAATAFERPAVGRGLAVGDLDNDGDADLVFNDAEGRARVLINLVGQDRSWLGVELEDEDGLDPGEGLTVTARQGDTTQVRLRRRGGSYLSSDDPRVLFGLGEAVEPVSITVRWRHGREEAFGPLEVRRYHRLRQGQGRAVSAP